MSDLNYWFGSSLVWLSLMGGILSLIFNFYGMGEVERSKHPKKLIAASILYILFSCYLLGQQNKDSDKKNQKLQDKIDQQTIVEKDTRDETVMIYSLLKKSKIEIGSVMPQPTLTPIVSVSENLTPYPTPRLFDSTMDLIIRHLKNSIAWGTKIQQDGSNGDMKFEDYIKERENWLQNIRFFLLTDKILQTNERWKNWSGFGPEGFENRDELTESDYPSTSPPDRRNYYRDNGRRILNLQFYLKQLGG